MTRDTFLVGVAVGTTAGFAVCVLALRHLPNVQEYVFGRKDEKGCRPLTVSHPPCICLCARVRFLPFAQTNFSPNGGFSFGTGGNVETLNSIQI
jgi:hypothetical protein